MHVLVATDGSKQSLESAKYLRTVVDADSVTKVSVVAVVSPLAAVPFAAEGSDDGGVGGMLSEILTGGGGRRQGVAEALAKSVVRSVGGQVGRQVGNVIVRGVLGSILKR